MDIQIVDTKLDPRYDVTRAAALKLTTVYLGHEQALPRCIFYDICENTKVVYVIL